MKNLYSTTEGVWLEKKSTQLTEQQRTLLNSNDNEIKKELIAELKKNNNATVSAENLAIAQGIYNDKKPILKDGDIYELIAVNIQLNDEGVTGIINCRVNEEHIQVRF